MSDRLKLLSPEEIIAACTALSFDSPVVTAAKTGILRQVDEIQNRADPELALLFQSLYAEFHDGHAVMRALSKPSLLQAIPSDQGLTLGFKPSSKAE